MLYGHSLIPLIPGEKIGILLLKIEGVVPTWTIKGQDRLWSLMVSYKCCMREHRYGWRV
jgi:hypothetical protein